MEKRANKSNVELGQQPDQEFEYQDLLTYTIDTDIARKFLDFNADAWEIFHEVEIKRSLTIEKGEIKAISEDREEGVAVRAILNGRVGFAFTTDPESIIETCEMAVKLSKVSEENLKDFSPGGIARVSGIFSKKAADVDSSWFQDAADRLISESMDMGVNPAQGSIEVSVLRTSILTSSGADLSSESTASTATIECVFEDGSAYDMAFSRTLDLDLERIARNSAWFAKNSAKGGKTRPDAKTYDVVFSPLAAHQLLYFALYPAFSLENILKGRSPLADRKGEEIFGRLNLIDDGSADDLFMSSPFDDEGNKTERTVLVKEGVLENFLNDLRHAQISEGDPTGNGLRIERNSYPAIGPTNMIIEPLDRQESFDDVLYIHSLAGAHTSNPISGDFSLECANSYILEGEIKPVKTAMIYGNVYELLKRIEYGGKEFMQFESTVTPWLRFKDVRVSSGV
jgi:PmbA protein